MADFRQRTEMLVGRDGLEKLKSARVMVFGIGGVGGFLAEALCRAGIGHLDLIDNDNVDPTNINRQIIAMQNTVGRPKVDVMEERLLLINPDMEIRKHKMFFLPDTEGELDFRGCSYIADAIDTVAGKIRLAEIGQELGIPVISAMGAGNKMDPSAFMVADIYETSVCPLARVMRKELKERGVEHLKVVYSREKPLAANAIDGEPEGNGKRAVPGSISFVPGTVGLIMAGEIIKDILKTDMKL